MLQSFRKVHEKNEKKKKNEWKDCHRNLLSPLMHCNHAIKFNKNKSTLFNNR